MNGRYGLKVAVRVSRAQPAAAAFLWLSWLGYWGSFFALNLLGVVQNRVQMLPLCDGGLRHALLLIGQIRIGAV